MHNRIRILNEKEFKIVGLNDLKFKIGYYRCSDHRFHGVDIALNNNDYNNHLFEYRADNFIDKFNIHPDDAEWLMNKIANMNKIEDDRVLIDGIEFSLFHNAREYSIVVRCDEEQLNTEFYSIADVVFSWAAQKIVDSNMDCSTKFIAFNALKKFAKERGCNPNTEREDAILKELELDSEEAFMY